MDEGTMKTANPKCRLFFKIDLLTDFAAMCLTDFIDWRYIHSWLPVNCCPHGGGGCCIDSLSDQIQNKFASPPQTKMTSKDDI
jgi:hypothetical protein